MIRILLSFSGLNQNIANAVRTAVTKRPQKYISRNVVVFSLSIILSYFEENEEAMIVIDEYFGNSTALWTSWIRARTCYVRRN